MEELNRTKGKTVVMVVHDLNHAARYADHMMTIHQGTLAVEGAPADILTPQILLDVFGVRAHILHEEGTGVPIVVPYQLNRL